MSTLTSLVRTDAGRLAQPTVRTLSLHDPSWARFAASRPEAGPFHSAAWTDTLHAAYGFEPFALTLQLEGRPVAGLPVVELRTLGRRRWVSLPYSDDCPPLLAPGLDPSVLTAALERTVRERHLRSFEVRATLPTIGQDRLAAPTYRHHLDLRGGTDAVFARMHPSQVRRAVRRAQREGVRVEEAGDREGLQAFYALHVVTRQRLGVPVQPRRYISALWRSMLASGHGFALVAYGAHGRVPVAASVFLTGGTTVIYKYGASSPEGWALRANHAVLWAAIQRGCESGATTFDFGRTDLEDESLRSFKSRWGTRETLVRYSLLGEHAVAPRSSLPPVVRASLRRSPAWLTRAAGELAYGRLA